VLSVLGLVCAASSYREAGVKAILGGEPEGALRDHVQPCRTDDSRVPATTTINR